LYGAPYTLSAKMGGTAIAPSWGVVLASVRDIERGLDLSELWAALQHGRFALCEAHCASGRCFATLKPKRRDGIAPSPRDAGILQRMLAGESQKVLAWELGLAVSTIATRSSDALDAMVTGERVVSRAPILLVMAALAARGSTFDAARWDGVAGDARCRVSVEIPGRGFIARLSAGQFEVARLTIEGKTHAEIGLLRGTSLRTVANQLAAVYTKLGVSGRSALRAKAALDTTRWLDPEKRSAPQQTFVPSSEFRPG
jgi:DNA-binding CsgD family transcriptional regulator